MMCVPVVSVPTAVSEFTERFSPYFHQPELRHLGRYLTGLTALVNKTASGMCGLLFDAPHSSNLTRFIASGKWENEEVQELRLEKERERFSGSSSRQGNLVLDDFIVEKSGKQIALCSRHHDHSDNRWKWGHCYVSSLLVHREGVVPMDLKLYVRQKDCAGYGWEFRSKNELFRQSLKQGLAAGLAFACVVFDAWYLNRRNCDFIEEHGLSWIARMKANMKVRWQGETLSVKEWYEKYGTLRKQRQVKTNPYQGEPKTYTVTEATLYVCFLGRKAKVVVSCAEKGELVFLLTNRSDWSASHVLTRYGYRWMIETLHKDLKQHLGLGECEMRTKEAVLHHASTVLMGATLLDEMVRQSGLVEWAQHQRSTALGSKQRFLLASLVRDFILWLLHFVGAEESKCQSLFAALHEHLNRNELSKLLTEVYHPKEDTTKFVKEHNISGKG